MNGRLQLFAAYGSMRTGRKGEKGQVPASSPGTPETLGPSIPESRPPDGGSKTAPGASAWLSRSRWFGTPSGLTLLTVLAFMAAGGYDRLEALGSASIWNDEAQSTLYALTILQHGYPVIASPQLINNWEPLYPYLEAVSILALGHSNLAYRLPSALLGIGLIPVSYVVGSHLRDRYVGLTLAAMIAFSTEFIAWSRSARWYVLLILIMALGLLFAYTWYRAQDHRTRLWCALALVVLAGMGCITAIGLFLLYVPGVLSAGLIYLTVSRWERVTRFFGRRSAAGMMADLPTARFVPYRYRARVLLVAAATVACLLYVEQRPLATIYVAGFTRVVGFPPYSPVWSFDYGSYLLAYYPGIIALAVLAAVFILLRPDPFDLALVGFCAASFVSATVGASFTNPGMRLPLIDFERHLLPLLYFLFVLTAISVVELLRRACKLLSHSRSFFGRPQSATPALFGVVAVALLILPGVVVPSHLYTYPSPVLSPADSRVPWFAFSLDPAYPSALYGIRQPNFQLASDYVREHRNAADVVGAANPQAPTVYLGHVVQYWVQGNANPSTIIYVHGQPTFYQTGSLLISNTSQFEALLYQHSGWLITDEPAYRSAWYPSGMNLVFTYFMSKISTASDVSISLYHWNESTTPTLLQMFQARVPGLGGLGTNVTRIANWAAIFGVTSVPFRDLFLPMEGSMLPLVSAFRLPLAILVNVYDHRSDLQAEFPQVLARPSNYTALIQWAYQVASGNRADAAYSELAPYVGWYQNHQ